MLHHLSFFYIFKFFSENFLKCPVCSTWQGGVGGQGGETAWQEVVSLSCSVRRQHAPVIPQWPGLRLHGVLDTVPHLLCYEVQLVIRQVDMSTIAGPSS